MAVIVGGCNGIMSGAGSNSCLEARVSTDGTEFFGPGFLPMAWLKKSTPSFSDSLPVNMAIQSFSFLGFRLLDCWFKAQDGVEEAESGCEFTDGGDFTGVTGSVRIV